MLSVGTNKTVQGEREARAARRTCVGRMEGECNRLWQGFGSASGWCSRLPRSQDSSLSVDDNGPDTISSPLQST